ncbi:YbbR-like protein [Jeotgalicoccus aerolatus]|uniref:YbbR domain-containing protein n=1 Tax=Jeotgalicoccus aerolatus TaxID=709510 RepID=A0ABS4HJ76_9STAP|nr:CdaR family protein [Jeotgalicoccus aerolatus]MBP1950979.1 YbbR domain-containing protein [Jeotgalicoccus aerolatus]GGE01120.1 hypothetical protein GCM10007273_12020 [Jeotgalicoccus aerolatus]CAD2078642.1 YbbR-like protein [Jeotgalicoccus aerolatus]
MLENKLSVSIVALLLALFMFVNANNVFEDMNLFNDEAENQENTEFIEGVPVEVLYDEESYYVSGVPQEVTVELGGANSNVKRLQATRNFEVVLDLRNREPGEYEVFFTVNGLPENVSGTVQPETANVTIQNLVTQTFEVQVEVSEGRVGSSYQLDSVNVEPSTVTVSGGESTMNRIQYVRAMMTDTSRITEERVEEAEVSAFDAQYNKLDVEIEPSTVRIEIDVNELSKEVPVYQETTGEVADGNRLSDVELNHDTIEIYGDRETLSSISSVTAEVDVGGMSSSGKKDVRLELPENVTKSEPAVLEADVTIEEDE